MFTGHYEGQGEIMAKSPASVWDRKTVPDSATVVVKKIEGFSATPYDDNGSQPGGTWTIGYGTIIDAQSKPVTSKTPPVTEAQAVTLLIRDMNGSAEAVARRVKATITLTDSEAAALISWTYNLGEGNLATSTMLKRINANAKSDVPDEMRKWINQAGKPLLGLLRRRWAEAAIFKGMDGKDAVTRGWNEIDDLGDWPPF
jgi:lysozyme